MKLKKACLYIKDERFLKNAIFDATKTFTGGKFLNQHIIFIELKKKLLKYNINLSTQDINSPKDSIFTIFRSIPFDLNIINTNKSYLLLTETQCIIKRDFDPKLHKYFKKIFTYDVQNKENYIEFFDTSCFEEIVKTIPQKNKNIVMITSNKRSAYKNELYSKRYKLIKYLEKNYKKNFNLYGQGWNQPPIYVDSRKDISFEKIIDFLLKKLRFNNKAYILKDIYKGTIKNKYDVLKKHNFSICIQNTYEKNSFYSPIFESFYCSCIPIYQGASNIEDHVPTNCFIDLRNFRKFDLLLNFINNLSMQEILKYKDNIYNYLNSNKHKKFTNEYQAQKIFDNINIDIK